MSDIDTAELRRLAEGATPGPWEMSGGGEYIAPIGILAFPDDGGVTSADARYIAAANPQTVLALLDEVERFREALRIQTEETRAVAVRSPSHLTVLQLEAVTAERDRLRAQVEKVRALADEWERCGEGYAAAGVRGAAEGERIRVRALRAALEVT